MSQYHNALKTAQSHFILATHAQPAPEGAREMACFWIGVASGVNPDPRQNVILLELVNSISLHDSEGAILDTFHDLIEGE